MYKRSLCLCCLSYRKCLVWSYPVFEKRLDAEGVLAIFMCSVSADAFDIDRFMPLAERIFTDGGTDGGGGGGGGNGAQCIANAAASSSSKSGGFRSNGGGGGGGSNSNANANANANSRESMYIADLSDVCELLKEVFPFKKGPVYVVLLVFVWLISLPCSFT